MAERSRHQRSVKVRLVGKILAWSLRKILTGKKGMSRETDPPWWVAAAKDSCQPKCDWSEKSLAIWLSGPRQPIDNQTSRDNNSNTTP